MKCFSRGVSGTLAGAVLMAALSPVTTALADDHRGRGHEERREDRREDRRDAWRGDIHRFHEHDFERWRGGRWWHGRHEGRLGRWWLVGGLWYFYPTPVYPYPDPYRPPIIVNAPVPPVEPAQPQFWYYCANPRGYYPYVTQCYSTWQRVLAAP